MKIVQLIIAVFVSIYTAQAQHKKNIDRSWELAVGSELPRLPIMDVLNDKTDKVDLNKFKDRLVILDFWDTSCVTCIELMPDVKKVQEQMGDKVKILMVTAQSKQAIQKFFRNNGYLKERNAFLPSIVGDSLLHRYFPHRGVPHTVFIYKGTVKAVTYADYIKPEFINQLIATGKLDVQVKNDFNDRVVGQEPTGENVIGRVLVTGFQPELAADGGLPITQDPNTGNFICRINNAETLGAYQRLFAQLEKPKFLWIPGRIIWKVKDKNKYRYQEGSGGRNLWKSKHAICYQRISRDTLPKAAMAEMAIQDLNFFLGLNVYKSRAVQDVIVIKKVEGKQQKVAAKAGGQTVEGAESVAFLLDLSGLYPPTIDESGYKGVLELGAYDSLEALNEQLAYYGLQAVMDRREIEVMVFEERR
ncbi:TlpA family protein disulfide reductase [Sphingobacterium thalpophilum]|uniref:Thiol-disulfide oxidoreductase n=1 Tax=Sphingobacterium thalpophilum TaxID=259 RepID=A0A4U9UXS4_9SPHI|nr:TlpA disulfide reductase family protein [Sphingobacterium thalpophilum]VTR34731.1 thiol-disulfide oxidoreductase [Sphingobacterium thalpophilum]